MQPNQPGSIYQPTVPSTPRIPGNQNGPNIPGSYQPKPDFPASLSIGQVHGSAGAGYYWVAPGGTAYLFDLDAPRFYIKRVDEVGRPYPLETCEYTRVVEEPPVSDTANFASKEDVQTLQNNINDINTALQLVMTKLDGLNKQNRKPPRKEKNDE